MGYFPQAEKAKIYRKFKDLDTIEYQAIVHFVEENLEVIQQLAFDRYLELIYTYNNALFETGRYKKQFRQADELIQLAILHNIHEYRGEDLYRKVLFQKAASAYQLMRYDEAVHILRELIRMSPEEPLYPRFLAKCLRARKPAFLRHLRALAILAFLLTALIIALEILVVRSIYPQELAKVMLFRNLLFAFGIVLLVGGELVHRWRAWREALK